MQRKNFNTLMIMFIIFLIFTNSYAEKRPNFQAIFASWTNTFNGKKFPEVCDIFSKSLTSSYQGSQKRNFTTTCNIFNKIFNERDTVYHNDFIIHQVYQSLDFAAVRITW